MGKNSRGRHKAKQKAARQEQRRRHIPASGPDPFGLFAGAGIPSQRQIAEDIIDDAVHARHHGHASELKRCQTLLAEGPGGAIGVQVVNRTLFTLLLRDVKQSWDRGWQPAELVRMTRREHTARHGRLMIDAIGAQMRVYPVATVDPRWQSQLSTVDATVWWEHDDLYLDVWREQQGLDRATAIDHLLDLLYLLRTLPPIASVGWAPGGAQPAGTATSHQSDAADQRMLDRVRALLAKAESTDFPEESDAFTTKAQQLMARHSIDHALVAARTGARDEPVTRRIGIDNPYEAPKTLLLQVVAEANRCRAVWMKRFGFTTVVGFPADVDSVELLFTSLLVQATRTMTHLSPRPDRYGRNTTRSFRQSFLTAYASRIGERLQRATHDVDREMSTAPGGSDLLPVLAARSDAVQDAFATQFPELSSHATPISNREGWASGRAAADRASLHGSQAVTR